MAKRKRKKGAAHKRWELIGCGMYGHVTYKPDENELYNNLHINTPQGESWRCLRCGNYVPGAPISSGPADNAPVPKRDNELREAVVMRFLALERIIRALILYVAAYGVWKFDGSRDSVAQAVKKYLPDLNRIAEKAHYNLTDAAPMKLVDKATHASHHTLTLIILGLIAYGTIELAEGIGLWSLKRWGEYVAVVGTSVFLPVEMYELTETISILKIITLLINIALVIWLVYSKRLFGVRGGGKAYEEQNHDESIMEIAKANTIEQIK